MNKSILLGLFLVLSSSQAYAIDNDTKKNVQDAMKTYVAELVSSEGHLPVIYQGKVLSLKVQTSDKYPDGFHAGVKNEGGLYTSCADFVDNNGNIYDVDFLVAKVKTDYKVVQPIVHSVNGVKSKYDLKH